MNENDVFARASLHCTGITAGKMREPLEFNISGAAPALRRWPVVRQDSRAAGVRQYWDSLGLNALPRNSSTAQGATVSSVPAPVRGCGRSLCRVTRNAGEVQAA